MPKMAPILALPVVLPFAVLSLNAVGPSSVTFASESPAVRPLFADYRFEFSLVDDTVIPKQGLWLRWAQTNITDHGVPKLDMTPGGPVYSIRLVDTTEMPLPIGMPHFDAVVFSKGALKPGETDVGYFPFGFNVWFFTPESLQTALVGHTSGLAIQFSTYVFGEADSLKMKRPQLPFTVIEATGPEAEAVALLKKGKCREMLERFPHSRFVDEALRALHFSAKPPEQLELAREQARMNPASPQLISWATEIKLRLGVAQYNSFVAELAKNHPKARALEVLKEEK
jgi:hypothetical protein